MTYEEAVEAGIEAFRAVATRDEQASAIGMSASDGDRVEERARAFVEAVLGAVLGRSRAFVVAVDGRVAPQMSRETAREVVARCRETDPDRRYDVAVIVPVP